MEQIKLKGPGVILEFNYQDNRLNLEQIKRYQGKEILEKNKIGNPLSLFIYSGKYKGFYGMDSLIVKNIKYNDCSLTALLECEEIPFQILMMVDVEGHVITWKGQACWEGKEKLETGIYFPVFSKVSFSNKTNKAIVPRISGSVINDISKANYFASYLGNLSSPCFLIEGDNNGLAFLDNNMSDYAPHPGNCVRRSYLIGNDLSKYENMIHPPGDMENGGKDGPFVGICHSRSFKGQLDYDQGSIKLSQKDKGQTAEGLARNFKKEMWSGDYVDLGPVQVYAYKGNWKAGASWLRKKRKDITLRKSPAKWYRQTTMIAEDMGDDMVKKGQTFYDYPVIMAEKEELGSNLFHLPGYHDSVKLNSSDNWLNRGDYFFAAQNLGGFEAVKRGIDAVHRRGGHVLYYVELLIMWKLSRIGMEKGKDWALMKADGSYTEHYKGFWHMCPACEEWQEWLAETCAEIVRTTGVDGFFLDSAVATHNHRCYNPDHNHPHPDVWNWGLRKIFARVRKAVDEINPETIIFAEGCGDMPRESVDGFITHSHMWNKYNFDIPFVRFLHPNMRAYESWSSKRAPVPIQKLHIWNFVTGHRIYCHNPDRNEMKEMSLKTRRYYDMFPEICDNDISVKSIGSENCIAELFGKESYVITVGNVTDEKVRASLEIPVPCGVLFDRLDSKRIPVIDGKAKLELKPWEFRAFEIRE